MQPPLFMLMQHRSSKVFSSQMRRCCPKTTILVSFCSLTRRNKKVSELNRLFACGWHRVHMLHSELAADPVPITTVDLFGACLRPAHPRLQFSQRWWQAAPVDVNAIALVLLKPGPCCLPRQSPLRARRLVELFGIH